MTSKQLKKKERSYMPSETVHSKIAQEMSQNSETFTNKLREFEEIHTDIEKLHLLATREQKLAKSLLKREILREISSYEQNSVAWIRKEARQDEKNDPAFKLVSSKLDKQATAA